VIVFLGDNTNPPTDVEQSDLFSNKLAQQLPNQREREIK